MTAARRRILITTEGAAHCRDAVAALERDDVELVARYDLGDRHDGRALGAALAGAWGVIAGSEPYTADILRRSPGLRAIVRFGTGHERIDVEAATANGVVVCTVPGANGEAVADMTLALALACVRRLRELDAGVRNGTWRLAGLTRDLAFATVGIVGLGAIGKAVARRLRGFDCRLLAVEPRPDPDFCALHGIELADLHAMLPRVDLLSLHAPLLPATRHLIGERELALLPSHAVVVNTARGGLVDEAALARALADGTIGGAGLDVFEREPLPDASPLRRLGNVVLSGHASSFTQLASRRTGEAVVATMRALLAERLPPNCLNPRAWSGGAVTRSAPAPRARPN